MSRPKYQLKKASVPMVELKRICINCGYTEVVKHPVILPTPSTTGKIVIGLLGPKPGSWLGCKVGSHDMYFEHEIERTA
jgi:hypothetical protein